MSLENLTVEETNVVVILFHEEDNPDLPEPFVINVGKIVGFPQLQQDILQRVQNPKQSYYPGILYNSSLQTVKYVEDSDDIREAINNARINLPATIHGNITIWWR